MAICCINTMFLKKSL